MSYKNLVLCFLILLVCFSGLTGCREEKFPEPYTVIEEFIQHWQHGEYESMFHLISEESKKTYDQETFANRYSNISQGINLEEVSLVEYDYEILEDGSAEIIYKLKFVTSFIQEFTQQYTASLQKGEENWLMDWSNKHIFEDLTSERFVRVSRQFPERGNIFDRNGIPLAYNGNVREIGVVTGKIEDENSLLRELSALLQMSEETIQKKYTQSWVQPDMFAPIKRISEKYWDQHRDDFLAIKGVMINTSQGRVYNIPSSAAQTLGYITVINAEQLQEKKLQGYRAGDYIGVLGLETYYEKELAGEIGFTIYITDENNKVVTNVAEKAMQNGANIHTLLDSELMQVVHDALKEHNGSAIIMNNYGDILAAASNPGFDSNHFSLGITSEQYRAITELDNPFLNRAFNGLYPPGSILKPFTALMALEEDVVDPEYSWNTPKQWQKDAGWGSYHVTRVDRPSGPVDLWKAMKWSDNVYFADLALRIGWESFSKHAENLGFGAQIPFPLNTRTSKLGMSSTNAVLLADTGYGQGEMQSTPLHMTLLYVSLSRGDGILPEPIILQEKEFSPWLSTNFSLENIVMMNDVLKTAVQDSDSLAAAGHIPGKDIRGKTGTAQIGSGNQIGWYVCFFDDYVITVTLEGDNTMYGSQAVNVAVKIIENGM